MDGKNSIDHIKYIHAIVVVNGQALLREAVNSIRQLWPDTVLIDNSADGWIGKLGGWPVQVVRPDVPLSVAQTMNFLQRRAVEQGADVWGYQHADAICLPCECARYMRSVSLTYRKAAAWAALLTHYDTLSAYRTAAVTAVGPWDTAFPDPNYMVDLDWFHRAQLAGLTVIQSKIKIKHYDRSTVRLSAYRTLVDDKKRAINREYYKDKWGGDVGCETFARPWNGQVTEGDDVGMDEPMRFQYRGPFKLPWAAFVVKIADLAASKVRTKNTQKGRELVSV